MRVEFSEEALTGLRKTGKTGSQRVLRYLDSVSKLDNPRLRGKALTGNLSGLWRYRIGDYRAICIIEDDVLLVTVLRVGHRKDIYDKA